MYTFTLKMTLTNEIKVLKADLLEEMVRHFLTEGYYISNVVMTKSNTCVMDRVAQITCEHYIEWKNKMVTCGMFN